MFASRSATVIAGLLVVLIGSAHAEKLYGPGVSDTEIKIGNTMPYSGPASSLSTIGKALDAYFKMINAKGGVNGRRVQFVSRDDAFSPPKTVEQTRKLVEDDGVSLIFGTIGTAPNTATQKYLNTNKVPQLFIGSSAEKWNDPAHFPWTMALSWQPNYADEAKIHLRYFRGKYPSGRVAILYQNDDAGKEFMKGVKEALGNDESKVVALALPFDLQYPTIDSEIARLATTKADAFMIYSVTPRACAQAIRTAYTIGWRPDLRFLSGSCPNIEAVLKPAGLEKAEGLVTMLSVKLVTPATQSEPDVAEFIAFMRDYVPDVVQSDSYAVYAYLLGNALREVLTRCGDDLTRENIMKQASSLKDIRLPLLLPGISINTSSSDYRPIRDAYLARFDGTEWVIFGDALRGD
ncbi:ABC transporter substrate-binding protein [Bradyrhizobium sp. 195]|uniref:ABC transporter substrate-binding protein n=1 Tax=Bradyrhizobium sp. 195 TaxID=2782662 RepID=UPI002000FCB2|nr:ABC transporter substrate-binding protein [Bradyrhizobium sp. 195]UPK25421.1 ABC transporter substrate-binding protein [Bradyrhizobium sp. 195]